MFSVFHECETIEEIGVSCRNSNHRLTNFAGGETPLRTSFVHLCGGHSPHRLLEAFKAEVDGGFFIITFANFQTDSVPARRGRKGSGSDMGPSGEKKHTKKIPFLRRSKLERDWSIKEIKRYK